MAEHEATREIDAAPHDLFAYVSDVNNLPKYFSRMVSARPGDGEEVHTQARLPDGRTVEGSAWFRVDDGAQRIEWGSEGESDYHGWLEVSGDDARSQVTVHLHSHHDGDEVERGIASTLDALAEQCGTAA